MLELGVVVAESYLQHKLQTLTVSVKLVCELSHKPLDIKKGSDSTHWIYSTSKTDSLPESIKFKMATTANPS